MFDFIFFNVFEIFVAAAFVFIIGVLIFATINRSKMNAAEHEMEGTTSNCGEEMALREVGLVSAGMARTVEPEKEQEQDKPDAQK